MKRPTNDAALEALRRAVERTKKDPKGAVYDLVGRAAATRDKSERTELLNFAMYIWAAQNNRAARRPGRQIEIDVVALYNDEWRRTHDHRAAKDAIRGATAGLPIKVSPFLFMPQIPTIWSELTRAGMTERAAAQYLYDKGLLKLHSKRSIDTVVLKLREAPVCGRETDIDRATWRTAELIAQEAMRAKSPKPSN